MYKKPTNSNWGLTGAIVPLAENILSVDSEAPYKFNLEYSGAASSAIEPERNLMRGLLFSAMRDMHVDSLRPMVRAWVREDEYDVMAFNTVCTTLRLSPTATRKVLLAQIKEMDDAQSKAVRRRKNRDSLLQPVGG